MTQIIGYHPIPKQLIGSSNETILNWARKILLAQEPNLKKSDITAIREGKLSKIFLEPKIPGTYLLNGTFIKAYDYRPTIGEDFEKADQVWEKEEELDTWADEENKIFTKQSKNKIRDLWEHGKRIIEFSDKMKIPIQKIYQKLEQRGTNNTYTVMKHEYCVLLYQWKKDLKESDPVLSLTWKKIAHIVMFGKSDDSIKEYVISLITSFPLNLLTSPEVALLLQENLQREEYSEKYLETEQMVILNIRNKLKFKQNIEIDELEQVVKIIKKKKPI